MTKQTDQERMILGHFCQSNRGSVHEQWIVLGSKSRNNCGRILCGILEKAYCIVENSRGITLRS